MVNIIGTILFIESSQYYIIWFMFLINNFLPTGSLIAMKLIPINPSEILSTSSTSFSQSIFWFKLFKYSYILRTFPRPIWEHVSTTIFEYTPIGCSTDSKVSINVSDSLPSPKNNKPNATP